MPLVPMRPFSPPVVNLLLEHSIATLILLDYLPAEVDENVVDVCSSLGGRFVVWFLAPTLSELKRSGSRHNSVILHIGFVAYYD